MDRKLKSASKNLQTSKSKEVQSKNTSPNGNIASKYQLRNLYVSLQRLPPSDVDKWKNCDQFSKTSMEINISQESKNDNKTMVKSRKSNNSTMKKVFDENKIENFDDSSGTADSKNISDTTSKQLSHLIEQDDEKSLSMSRRSSLRNASANVVNKNVLPSTSKIVKNESLKDDTKVNISPFSSDQNINENKNLLETNLSLTKVKSSKIEENKLSVSVTSSNSNSKNKSKETDNDSTHNHLENVVRHLRSKTINKSDENSLQSQKKQSLKTLNNESESSNKLKRTLDEDENGSEHKVILKKIKKISESEDSLEKIGPLCNTSDSSSPNITELKPSRKMKSTLNKSISSDISDSLNKSNNDLQKEKRKISKESDLSEEEPRLLRSSTIKQTQSYDSKLEDKKSIPDNPKSPPIFDQNRCTTKTNVEKDKFTSINTSDEKKKTKQSSDADSIEPRVLRSSTLKQITPPSKDKIESEDTNKTSDTLYNDSPESPPLTEQLGSPNKTKIVLLKEISSKKLVKSGIIRDPRKINKIVENPTIDIDSKNQMCNKGNSSKEIEQPSPSSNLNQISNTLTTNLGIIDFEENSKVKKSSVSKLKESSLDSKTTMNEILPSKKEISLFDSTKSSKNIRPYSRKGKRKYKINNQFEINDSSKVENEIIIDVAETSIENIQIDKTTINTLHPRTETQLDEIKDKSKVAEDPSPLVSVQEVGVPTVLKNEQEKSNFICTSIPQDKPPSASSDVGVSNKTVRTRKKDSIPKGSLKLTTESFTNAKNKYARSGKSCNHHKKTTDLSTFIQISKMNKIITEMFHVSNFKDVSKNDDSYKKLTITEEDPTKSNDITETTVLPKPKKLRKDSSNNPYDDKKTVPALSPNITTKNKITVSEKNKVQSTEKRTNNVIEDLNKLNSSVFSTNIASQSQSPTVEISSTKEEVLLNTKNVISSTPRKYVTKFKKKKNSLPSTLPSKLSYPSELTKMDKNSVKDNISANTSNEISSSQTIPASKDDACKDDDDSKRDQLLKTNQGIIEKDSAASTSNKTSETPPVPEVNIKLLEKIESKESLTTKKLSTPKQPLKRASKQESPLNKSNEFLELHPQAKVNNVKDKVISKKNFSVPVKKLSTPKQLSKRVINKKSPSNKPNELLKSPTQTTVDDSIQGNKDTEKDISVLANQLPSSRQILKRAVKKETPASVSKEILQLSPNNLIEQKVGVEKETILPSKKLPPKSVSKNNEIVVQEGNNANLSPPTQITSNDVIKENVGLKKDTSTSSKTLPKRQLSKSNESIVKMETSSIVANQVSKSPPTQTISSDIIKENVGLKKGTSSPSKILRKKQLSKSNESIVKEETSSTMENQLSKQPPAHIISEDIIKENVGLKKCTPSPSKALLKRQLSKCNESIVKEETSSTMANQDSKLQPAQTISNDITKENIDLKRCSPSPSKALLKKQLSKSSESIVKEETSLTMANQDSKLQPTEITSDDITKVGLKRCTPSPSKALLKRQLSKSSESIVKEETSLTMANQDSKLQPTEITSDDITKVGLKKVTPSPSKVLLKKKLSKSNESIVKEETSLTMANQDSKLQPAQTASDDITKVGLKKVTPSTSKALLKRKLSKSNENLVKVETSLTIPNQISKSPPSQTASDDIIKENVGLKKGTSSPSKILRKKQLSKNNETIVKEETSSTRANQVSKQPSVQTTSDDITKENVGLKKGTSSTSKALLKRKLSKSNESIIKEETSSTMTNQDSKQPSAQTISEDITKENVGLKKGTSSSPKPLPKKQLPKNNKSVAKLETSHNISSEISKSSPSRTAKRDIIKRKVKSKKDIPATTNKLFVREIVVIDEPLSNTSNEISKLQPPHDAGKDQIKERIRSKKDSSLPSEKISSRVVDVIEKPSSNTSIENSTLPVIQAASSDLKKDAIDTKEDPTLSSEIEPTMEIVIIEEPSSNTSNKISTSSAEAASSGLKKDKIDSKEDPTLSSEIEPTMEIVIIEEPSSNTSNKISTSSPAEAATSGLKKDKIDSKEDPTLSSEIEPTMEMVIIEEPSSNTSNKISTSSPAEAASSGLKKDKIDSKEDPTLSSEIEPTMEMVIIEEPSSNTSNKISTSSPVEGASSGLKKDKIDSMEDPTLSSEIEPTMEMVIIEEPSSNTSNKISSSSPAEAASSVLKEDKIDSKEDPTLSSEREPTMEIVIIEEPSSNTSNEISTSLPAKATSDLKKDKIESKEDPVLSSEIEPPVEIVVIEEPSSNNSKEIPTLPPIEAATSDLNKEKIDSEKLPLLLDEKVPNRLEVVVIEELSSNNFNEISVLPPTDTASSDIKKEKIDSKEDQFLSSEKVSPVEIVVVEEPSSNSSNEISTLSPAEAISSDLKKDKIDSNEDPSLPPEKISPRKIIVIDEASLNNSNEISTLPPTETANSDLKKEETDSKKDPSLPSEKISPREIVVVEEPLSNTSNETFTLPHAEASSSDLKKAKIDSKEDPCLSPEKISPGEIVVVKEPSSNTSNETSTLPPTEAISTDVNKDKVDSMEDSSLLSEKMSSREIVLKDEASSNSNEIATLLPTENAISDLKKEKNDSKVDPSLPSEKMSSRDIVIIDEAPKDSSNEISTSKLSQELIKKDIDPTKDASLPSQELSSSLLTETAKSAIIEEPAIDSAVEISKTLSTQVPSSNLINVEHTSTNIHSNSEKIIYKQATSDDLIKHQLLSNKDISLTTSKLSKSDGNNLIRSQIGLKKNTSTAKLSSQRQVSKKIKKDENVKVLKKIPKLPSPQMSRHELMKNIIAINGDISLASRNLSYSELSRMYRAVLYQQISNFKFRRSVYTQTEHKIDNDSSKLDAFSNRQPLVKKRKLNQGRSSLPLATNLSSTNHSFNVNNNILQTINFTNSSLVSRSSNGQPLEKKRKLNQGNSVLPLSRILTPKTIKDQYTTHSLHMSQKTNFTSSSLVSRSSNGQPLEKKRKRSQGNSILPLSRNQSTQTINDQYTNHSLYMLQRTNFPNYPLLLRSTIGQLLQRKRQVDQPLSTNLPSKNQIRKEDNSSKPSSLIGINERKETNLMTMKNIKSPRFLNGSEIKGESSSKSPVKVCSSCRRCSYTPPSSLSSKHLVKEFYNSQKESFSSSSSISSTKDTHQTCCVKDNSNKTINNISPKPSSSNNSSSQINNSNKKSNRLTSTELHSLRKQSIIDSLKNVRKNRPAMIIELVSPNFYRNVLKSSNYTSHINRTVNQAEHLLLNSTIIKSEHVNPNDHVFKVPTKAPPRAKNKKMTKSETFIVPKANELEVGILVRTSFGLAIKSGRTIIIPKELPEGIRFNLAYGLDKIYFRRKYICDQRTSENIKESKEINDLQFDNDYLSFKNKYEKPVLIGENIGSDEDSESNSNKNNLLLSDISDLNLDNLKKTDILKLRKARMELIRMYNKKGHFTPLTIDKIMSLLISHEYSKSGKDKRKFKTKTENFVTIKKSKLFDTKPTVEEFLKISGHDGYCTKLPPPPYYELMKRGVPFSPKHYFIAMQRKKNSVNPDYSAINLNNANNSETNLSKLPDNKLMKNQSNSIEPHYLSKELKSLIGTQMNPNFIVHNKSNILKSKETSRSGENILPYHSNFSNEEKFKYNLRTKSRLKSDKCNTPLKESVNNSSSPSEDSESDENESISDENSNSVTNKPEFQLDEYALELERLDQSLINATKNYKTSINVDQVNKDLRLIVPKDQYRKELPERPTEWFLKFVTKFRKLELWRLHNLFKVHDNLRRIETAKINILEKMYEKLSGNSTNDESET